LKSTETQNVDLTDKVRANHYLRHFERRSALHAMKRTGSFSQHGTNVSSVPFLDWIPWFPLQKFWETPNVASWLEFPVENSVAGELWSCNGVFKSFHLYQFKKQNDLLETQNSRVLGLLKNLYGCVKIRYGDGLCTSGDHERELLAPSCHCCLLVGPPGGGVFLPSHNKIHDTHRSTVPTVGPLGEIRTHRS
jgi:hypothetical protein